MFNINEFNVVAEIAQYHDGSLGRIYALIDALAYTGVNGIKFQIHNAEFESTLEEPWRVKFSKQDKTRFDYWKRMEFSKEQWIEIKKYVNDKKLNFICAPFSCESAKIMEEIGVDAWKIASGELNNTILLEYLVKTKIPIVCSTGMSTWSEINQAYSILKKSELIMLQCTSKYPTDIKYVGINNIDELKRRYNVPVGLSDHSGSIVPSMVATMLGVNYIEFHVCFSKKDFGPDVSSSLTIEEIVKLTDYSKTIRLLLDNPVDKNEMVNSLTDTRRIFNKSLCANKDLMKDSIITSDDIMCLKPCKGIPASKVNLVIGKRLKRAIKKGEFLDWCDIYE